MTTTEAIVTGILTGCAALGVAIRWSASVLKGAAVLISTALTGLTDETKKARESIETLSRDIHELKQRADLSQKLEQVVEAVVDEVSGVHDTEGDNEDTGEFSLATAKTPVARKTPPRGYRVIPRARSRGQ